MITNGPSRAQWQKIEKLKLRKYFDCVLVSGDLPWEKPDQHIFLEACKLLSVEPRMCIMVGDKLETDIRVSFQNHVSEQLMRKAVNKLCTYDIVLVHFT